MRIRFSQDDGATLLESSVHVPRPIEEVFEFFSDAHNLNELTPPWLDFHVVTPRPISMRAGQLIDYRLRLRFIPIRWQSEITVWDPPRRFVDEQRRGPYSRWHHEHCFEPEGNGTRVTDRVHYKAPGGALIERLFVRRDVETIFNYRTRKLLELFPKERIAMENRLKVAITGSNGMIGKALARQLQAKGHTVIRVVRGEASGKNEIAWSPMEGRIDAAALQACDAVVHLAGESIAEGRWNTAKKKRIMDSRVEGTRLLAQTLAKLSGGPRVLVSASAIGYYGDSGDRVMTEESASGDNFLAEVCRAWEIETEFARKAGIRTVCMRLGVVLSDEGGALKKMLLPFRLGAGGVVGSGRQYMSWISLADAVGAFEHALATPSLSGPVNLVSPNPVTNSEFTKALGRALHRPTMIPMPAFAARLAFGEMADELLLASTRVEPRKLQASGYAFRHPTIDQALAEILGSDSAAFPGAETKVGA